jgi:hypothetical protein
MPATMLVVSCLWCPVGGWGGVCALRGGGGGSGRGWGELYSPGYALFTRCSTVEMLVCVTPCSPSLLSCFPCPTRAEGGGVGLPRASLTSPAALLCFLNSFPSFPALAGSSRHLPLLLWLTLVALCGCPCWPLLVLADPGAPLFVLTLVRTHQPLFVPTCVLARPCPCSPHVWRSFKLRLNAVNVILHIAAYSVHVNS